MKKMKKFAALLLAVSMAAGMVAVEAQIKRKRLQKKKKPRKTTKRQRNWKEL